MLTLAIQQLLTKKLRSGLTILGFGRLRQSLHRCNDGDAIHHSRP